MVGKLVSAQNIAIATPSGMFIGMQLAFCTQRISMSNFRTKS